MNYFPTLFGNEFIKHNLVADIYSKTNSHAYIIEGDTGSGKHTVAKLCAAAMFCNRESNAKFPCGECSLCKKVLSGISVDVITVNRGERATLGVDTVREKIKEDLNYSPVESPKKIYIIEEADKMTPSAQNSLLLSLEEPPEFVVFFLLVNDASKLLETVRSRCLIYRTEKFTPKQIIEYLTDNKDYSKYLIDKDNFDYAVSASEGSIGKAVYLLENDDAEGKKMRRICKETVAALCSKRTYEKLNAVKDFPTDRNEICELLRHIKTAIRDLIVVKKQENPALLFYTDVGEVLDVSSKTSLKKLIALTNSVTNAESSLSEYVNISSVLTLFATEIQ